MGVLSAVKPLNIEWSFPGLGPEMAAEGRYICLEFEQCYVVNVYVPNSGTKRLDLRLESWEQ